MNRASMSALIRKPFAWLVLVTLAVSSCSTTMNLRAEDYARIDPTEAYHVVMVDGREFEAKNLVVKDDVATFTQDGVTQSVPVNEVKSIQQVTEHTILHGALAVGICALVVGGLVLLFKD